MSGFGPDPAGRQGALISDIELTASLSQKRSSQRYIEAVDLRGEADCRGESRFAPLTGKRAFAVLDADGICWSCLGEISIEVQPSANGHLLQIQMALPYQIVERNFRRLIQDIAKSVLLHQ